MAIRLVGWLVGWLDDWLDDWLVSWLVGWLVGLFDGRARLVGRSPRAVRLLAQAACVSNGGVEALV